jgi:hypothetical protein
MIDTPAASVMRAALSQTLPERLYLQQYILFFAAPASA